MITRSMPISSRIIIVITVLVAVTNAGTLCAQLANPHETRTSPQQLLAENQRPTNPWRTSRPHEAGRTLRNEVQADARSRRSLQSGRGEAGWEQGFFLASADGAFRLRILGQIQFRGVGSFQNNPPADASRTGFENTRTRLGFKGHFLDPSNQFFIWAVLKSPSTILDIWYKKNLGNGWACQVGQFKLPNWREWIISETVQQFTERSVLDARYRSLYSQGLQIYYTTADFRFQVAFSDGLQSYNNGFNIPDGNSPYLQSQTEFAVTARAAVRLGDNATWQQFADFESWDPESTGILLGASLHYQRGEYGTDTFENEILQWSADAALEANGFNLFAAAIGTRTRNEAGVNRHELGLLVQAGYFLNTELEIVARYEWGDLDGAGGAVGDDLSIITAGINKFFRRHTLKWSTDIGYALEPVAAAWGGAGRGWRSDTAGTDGQIVVRSQINILF